MREIDPTKMTQVNKAIDNYEQYYLTIGRPIVDEAVGELDNIVNDIKRYLRRCRELDLEFDSNSLQRMVVDISTCMYYTREKMAKIQLDADVAEMNYKNAVNEAYLKKQGLHDAGTKYSVKQLMAFAETEALEESIINFVYNQAVKEINSKLEDADNIYKACSKSLSAVMNDARLFNSSERYTA